MYQHSIFSTLLDPYEDEVEAGRKAGEERGKRQVEGRAKETIDSAAAALRSELAKHGIAITDEQARQMVLEGLIRANGGKTPSTMHEIIDAMYTFGEMLIAGAPPRSPLHSALPS